MKELFIINLFQDKHYATTSSNPVLVRTLPAATREKASSIVSIHLEIEVQVNDSRKEYGAGEFFATVEKFELLEKDGIPFFKKVPKKR